VCGTTSGTAGAGASALASPIERVFGTAVASAPGVGDAVTIGAGCGVSGGGDAGAGCAVTSATAGEGPSEIALPVEGAIDTAAASASGVGDTVTIGAGCGVSSSGDAGAVCGATSAAICAGVSGLASPVEGAFGSAAASAPGVGDKVTIDAGCNVSGGDAGAVCGTTSATAGAVTSELASPVEPAFGSAAPSASGVGDEVTIGEG
jgi:hypothetical protein